MVSHMVLCVFWYFRQFAIEKKSFPSFQFFTFPNFLQEAFVNGVDAPGRKSIVLSNSH